MALYYEPLCIGSHEPSTLNDILLVVCKNRRERVMLQKRASGWVPISSAEIYRNVVGVARALESWGIDHGDRVAILSENRPEWTITISPRSRWVRSRSRFIPRRRRPDFLHPQRLRSARHRRVYEEPTGKDPRYPAPHGPGADHRHGRGRNRARRPLSQLMLPGPPA